MKTVLIAALAALALSGIANAEIKSTTEYRDWLNKINQICKQQVSPLDNKEAFWNCLEEETRRTPPPEPHLEEAKPNK